MPAKTNFDELKKELAIIQFKLLMSSEISDAMKRSGAIMKREVLVGYNKSQFGIQSGRLLQTLMSDTPSVRRLPKQSQIVVGYGNLDVLNQVKRKKQNAIFPNPGGSSYKPIRIKLSAERDLPTWIIVEFGRASGSRGSSPAEIPREFRVNYKPRKKRPLLYARQSLSKHTTKSVTFQVSAQSPNAGGYHPGIKAGRIFRTGLVRARNNINKNLSEAINKIIHK